MKQALMTIIALEGIGGILFTFGSNLGAYLLVGLVCILFTWLTFVFPSMFINLSSYPETPFSPDT